MSKMTIDFQQAISGMEGAPDFVPGRREIAELHQELGSRYFNTILENRVSGAVLPDVDEEVVGIMTSFDAEAPMLGVVGGTVVVFTGYAPNLTDRQIELAGYALARILNGEQ